MPRTGCTQAVPSHVRSWQAKEVWLDWEQFRQLLHSPPYDAMLGCAEWRVGWAGMFICLGAWSVTIHPCTGAFFKPQARPLSIWPCLLPPPTHPPANVPPTHPPNPAPTDCLQPGVPQPAA